MFHPMEARTNSADMLTFIMGFYHVEMYSDTVFSSELVQGWGLLKLHSSISP